MMQSSKKRTALICISYDRKVTAIHTVVTIKPLKNDVKTLFYEKKGVSSVINQSIQIMVVHKALTMFTFY